MIIYVDIDDTLADYSAAMKRDLEFPQGELGFYRALEPLPDAVESVKAIMEFGYEVYFLSAPSLKNIHCWSEKAEWVVAHFGAHNLHRLIICADKSLLNGDILIDNTKQPYGTKYFMQFKNNWKEILEFLA